jgi:hypothetical protein
MLDELRELLDRWSKLRDEFEDFERAVQANVACLSGDNTPEGWTEVEVLDGEP